MNKEVILKVTAYITRFRNDTKQLLVFKEQGFEHLGYQVPGGTVEENESLLDALCRELIEEAAIVPFNIQLLGEYSYDFEVDNRRIKRYYYQMQADCGDEFTHIVKSKDKDNGWVYNYSWINMDESVKLHGFLGEYLIGIITKRMDNKIKGLLIESYDNNAKLRDQNQMAGWKTDEMNAFLKRLENDSGQLTLLDIGSGPGHHGKYFSDKGLKVTCIDISPSMVEACKEKALQAYVMDLYSLDFKEEFDAVWSMNCLLHVPKSSLGSVLNNIKQVMKPGGYFYMGVYGGYDFEGIWEEDPYMPNRFFSFYENEEIQVKVSKAFEIISFDILPMEGMRTDYQSMILKKN